VIGMLAIGAGAREESLSFIEKLGVRNLLIDSRPATNDQELQRAQIPLPSFFLVRPDGYIGLCDTRLDASSTRDYLSQNLCLST